MGKWVVTGASGFVGRAVVSALTARLGVAGCEPIAIESPRRGGPDLTTLDGWNELPGDVQGVVHLAAVLPGSDRGDASNARMAECLARRATSWPLLRRVVYASSISIYGLAGGLIDERTSPRNVSSYGESKAAGERALADLPSISLRISSVYGDGMATGTVLPLFMDRARRGEPITLYGDGSRTQDFIHMDDVVQGIQAAMMGEAKKQEPFNLGSGVATSMSALAMAAFEVHGRSPDVRFDPSRVDDAPSVCLDVSKARNGLGYTPGVSLTRGLERMRDALDRQG